MKRPQPIARTAPDRQHGAALLVFMLIFFLASISLLLSRADGLRSRVTADQTTSAALAQAREALIGRAVADKERPGSLPCPDFDDDGDSTNGSCFSVPGRLPWKTLDLPDLRDGDGNRLWYVLASELRDNGTTAINTALHLSLSLDGTGNIAAIVFSAGRPLPGKDGRPSNDIDDYLDGANKDGGPYISGPVSSTFNDKTIAISHDQLFSIINRRILRLILAELKKYYQLNGNYPKTKDILATTLNIGTDNMLFINKWLEVTKYEFTEDGQSATLTIKGSPATSCTINPTQEPSCQYP